MLAGHEFAIDRNLCCPSWRDENMKKRLGFVILLLALLPLPGCLAGKAWYYPYGPPYFEHDPGLPTIDEFLSQPRPE